MTAVEYIQSLERKVEELEGLLGRHRSGSLDDASTPPTSPSRQDDKPCRASTELSPSSKTEDIPSSMLMASGKSSATASDEDVIETMVGADEQDSSGKYRGSFAGLSLLKRVHNLCKHISASRKNSDVETLQDDFTHAFDFASPIADSSLSWDAFVMLPSRDSFDRAIDIVVDQACCNMQFLDRSALEQTARQVYAENEEEPRRQSRKPLALIYAVLALSRRFEPITTSASASAQNTRGYEPPYIPLGHY
jgi:hypothetical protein